MAREGERMRGKRGDPAGGLWSEPGALRKESSPRHASLRGQKAAPEGSGRAQQGAGARGLCVGGETRRKRRCASGSPKRGAPGNWNRFGEKEIHGGGTEAFEMWNAERTLKHSLGMGKTRSDERRRWMGRNQRLQNRG